MNDIITKVEFQVNFGKQNYFTTCVEYVSVLDHTKN